MSSKLRLVVWVLILFWPSLDFAQYQASNWVVPLWKRVININPIGISADTLQFSVLGFFANASISTGSGNLILFSTGADIRNKQGNYIDNGWNLCYCNDGANDNPHMQGSLILPVPGSDSTYYLFIKDSLISIPYTQPFRVTCSLIDMRLNNGLGKVVKRADPILRDTLSDSRMTACKHANGRDWWLINHEYKTNRIYTHLITPDSIYGPFSQYIGGAGLEPDNAGWSIFSQDGTRFATTTGGMQSLTLLDFDRCNGLFSNARAIPLNNTPNAVVLAFSPNGRFLYSANNYYLYQFDLQDIHIDSTAVELFEDTPGTALLGMMSLMPDGKIYIGGWTGAPTGGECLSVINNPDLKAPACDFHVRSTCIPGAVQIISAPNFPNYNLTALDGSGCDTLNMNIKPNEERNNKIRVYPNPAVDLVEIDLMSFSQYQPERQFCLYNTQGQLVKQVALPYLSARFSVSDLPAGMYHWGIAVGQDLKGVGKLEVVKE